MFYFVSRSRYLVVAILGNLESRSLKRFFFFLTFRLRGTTIPNGIRAVSAGIIHPRRCVSADTSAQVTKERVPPGLWPIENSEFSSRITAIKRLGEGSNNDSTHPQRSAMYTFFTIL